MITKVNSELINEVGEVESFPKNISLISKIEYRTILKKHLPDEVFNPDNKHVFLYATAMAVFFLGM